MSKEVGFFDNATINLMATLTNKFALRDKKNPPHSPKQSLSKSTYPTLYSKDKFSNSNSFFLRSFKHSLLVKPSALNAVLIPISVLSKIQKFLTRTLTSQAKLATMLLFQTSIIFSCFFEEQAGRCLITLPALSHVYY